MRSVSCQQGLSLRAAAFCLLLTHYVGRRLHVLDRPRLDEPRSHRLHKHAPRHRLENVPPAQLPRDPQDLGIRRPRPPRHLVRDSHPALGPGDQRFRRIVVVGQHRDLVQLLDGEVARHVFEASVGDVQEEPRRLWLSVGEVYDPLLCAGIGGRGLGLGEGAVEHAVEDGGCAREGARAGEVGRGACGGWGGEEVEVDVPAGIDLDGGRHLSARGGRRRA